MKKVISIFSVVILVVFASCSAESIEPLQEAVSVESEQDGYAIDGKQVRIDGKKPLIVVYKGDKKINMSLLDIEPNDIASMKVLKHAAATNAYGPDAKDGVIILYLKD